MGNWGPTAPTGFLGDNGSRMFMIQLKNVVCIAVALNIIDCWQHRRSTSNNGIKLNPYNKVNK